MAILSIPTNNSGDVFARAGVAMLGRLANVETYINGGATPVVGWKTKDPLAPVVGGVSVQSSATRVTYLVADLPDGAGVGSSVVIGALSYEVALATPNEVLGWMIFDLERV